MAAGITYVPPLLLEAGVEERYMTMVLGKGLVKTKRVTLQVYMSECQFTFLLLPQSFSHTFIVSHFPSQTPSDGL